jgi:hypothetical protein
MNALQRNALYKDIMMCNNDGVQQLYDNDITNALSSFQYATLQVRNLLHILNTIQNSKQEGCMRSAATYFAMTDEYHSMLYNITPSKHYVGDDKLCYDADTTDSCMEEELSSSHVQATRVELCSPHKPLIGLQDDNYYLHDRPLVFNDDSIGHLIRMDITEEMNEVFRGMIVITFNFALSCHLYAKQYGNTQSYHAAMDLYYLAWTISQNLLQNNKISSSNNDYIDMSDESIADYQRHLTWHVTIQCMTLNNLIHVHDEFSEFEEIRVCMKFLCELVFWNTRQSLCAAEEMKNNEDAAWLLDDDDDLDNIDNGYVVHDTDTRRKYNNNNNNTFVEGEGTVSSSTSSPAPFFQMPEEWEQFLLNIIYFHTPETARAA